MKKGLIFMVLSMMTVLASAKTFLDKTNLDQLNFRVLDAGQVTWNEEDGSAVIYVGSPTEVKNIRVADPTALRGFRYKTINDELTINASAAFTQPSAGVFRWVSSNSDTYKYEYNDIPKTGSDVKVSAYDSSHWIIGYATKNNDGTYTDVSLPVDTLIGGSNLTSNVQYAYKHKYVELSVEVISKDTNIQELDYVYDQSAAAGIGDMDPIGTERQIIYDGRHATINIKVKYTSGNGKYVQLSNFSAACIGIGDVQQANDLKQNKIFIYDRITDENGRGTRKIRRHNAEADVIDDGEEDPTAGAFDLYELRYWAKHLYDGNRGQDWSKYAASNHVYMGKMYGLYWSTVSAGEAFMGISGNSMLFSSGGESWFEYTPDLSNTLEGTEYEGVQIAFTSINNNASNFKNGNWVLEIIIDVPAGSTIPPKALMDVMYTPGLERPCLWYPIVCEWESLDNGVGKEWRITVPQTYSIPDKGFWKIKFRPFATKSMLKIKCTIQAMGADGRMYKLEWPEGGGAVTATLVE